MSNRYVPVDEGVFDRVSGLVAPFAQSVTDEVVAELNSGEGTPFPAYHTISAIEHYQNLSHNKGNRFVQHYNGVLDTETGLVAWLVEPYPPLWLVDIFNEGCYDDDLDKFVWSTIKEETE